MNKSKEPIPEEYWSLVRKNSIEYARQELAKMEEQERIISDFNERTDNPKVYHKRIAREKTKKNILKIAKAGVLYGALIGSIILGEKAYQTITLEHAQTKVVAKYGDLNNNDWISQTEGDRLLEDILWEHYAVKECGKNPIYIYGPAVSKTDYRNWIKSYIIKREMADSRTTPITNLFLMR